MSLFTGDPADYDEHEPLELEGVTITSTEVAKLTGVAVAASDCLFQNCDLSAMRFYGVKNSRFASCKLRGTGFSKHVRNVHFGACQLAECTFRMMVLDTITFADSEIVDCDFYGSTLTSMSFPSSSFEGVGFDACTIQDIDLCDATRLLIGDPRTLKGASMCETQVPLIARRLAQLTGINVLEC